MSGEEESLVVFTRLFDRPKFQDGSHKEGKKRYQGSGRPHLHVLIFGDDLEYAKLEQFISAAAPSDPVLRPETDR